MRLRAQALAAARLAYSAEMVDACLVLPVTKGVDAVGGQFDSWAESSGSTGEVACIFTMLSAEEQARQDSTLFKSVARLRLPIGTEVTRNDRVRITRRFGADLDDGPTFAVAGDPRETLGYLLVELAEVTT